MRCVLKSQDGSRELIQLYSGYTTIKSICEKHIPRAWCQQSSVVGLQRPGERSQISWYTNNIPALTSSGPSTYDAKGLVINIDEPIVAFFTKAREQGELKVELGSFQSDKETLGHYVPNFPCLHVNDGLEISFHRTVRVPDDEASYPSPNSLGAVPLLGVNQIQDNLPEDAVEKGGVLLPLHGEWIRFKGISLPWAR